MKRQAADWENVPHKLHILKNESHITECMKQPP